MTRYNRTLLTPPREEEEVYPYRRVWFSLIAEVGGILTATLVLYIAVGFLGISFPSVLQGIINLAIALLPALTWLVLAYWRESLALQPRQKMLDVFVLTVLLVNAAAVPLLNRLEPAQWLALSDTITRLIGYTTTIGIVFMLTKYIVVRYTIWPNELRTRLDAVAYVDTAAVAYATVTNISIALAGQGSPDVVAIRLFNNTAIHIAVGTILSYGIAQIRFEPRAFLILPFTLIMGAIISGLDVVARTAISNAGFFLGIGATRPIFGLVITAVITAITIAIMIFFFNTAERSAIEKERSAS